MTEGPVFVTVVPASTAKGVAVPNPTEDWEADAADVPTMPTKITIATPVPTASVAATQRRSRA
jgi:hypothetical protein